MHWQGLVKNNIHVTTTWWLYLEEIYFLKKNRLKYVLSRNVSFVVCGSTPLRRLIFAKYIYSNSSAQIISQTTVSLKSFAFWGQIFNLHVIPYFHHSYFSLCIITSSWFHNQWYHCNFNFVTFTLCCCCGFCLIFALDSLNIQKRSTAVRQSMRSISSGHILENTVQDHRHLKSIYTTADSVAI